MTRIQMLMAGAAVTTIFGLASPALATPSSESFILDTWRGSGSVPGNDFGTVLITQNGTNVDVKLTLSPNEGFVSTGAGEALLFDLNGISSLTITGLTTGFSALNTNGTTHVTTGGNYSGGGVGGGFGYAIDCSGCGNGGSDMLAGPISFTIANITLDEFTTSSSGYYFASDICVGTSMSGGKLQCNGTPGATGNVSAEFDAPGGPNGVPEPVTLSIFGAGLAGLVSLRRRKAAKA